MEVEVKVLARGKGSGEIKEAKVVAKLWPEILSRLTFVY